jgi:hypothetical protein
MTLVKSKVEVWIETYTTAASQVYLNPHNTTICLTRFLVKIILCQTEERRYNYNRRRERNNDNERRSQAEKVYGTQTHITIPDTRYSLADR